ncbi:hypothetical protein BDR26DRAFT_894827 [Obelidium mucronatum]|nr:hypothetical protein BDR26DRAFT_894827 [Obelidium mucronatum]
MRKKNFQNYFQMRGFILIALASVSLAETRCGSSWADANANCFTNCIFPDAVCPTGQQCFSNLASCNQTLPSSSAIPPVVVAPSPNVTSQVEGLFAQAPLCLINCLFNSTTISTSSIISLCQSQSDAAAANATIGAITSCIQNTCETADQSTATTFLGSNAVKLTEICLSLQPSNATASTTSSKLVQPFPTTTAAAVRLQPSADSDTIALASFGIFVALVIIAICVFTICGRRNN